MKSLWFSILFLTLFSCTKPISNSSLLGSSGSGTCTSFECTTDGSSTETGTLSIAADSGTISSKVDDSDIVEITGSCVDLDRKNNRIFVEVYAGIDESVTPYVRNLNSSDCQDTANTVTSGLELSDLRMANSVLMGAAQTVTLAATGGTLPYTFSIVSGTGSINASTGAYTSVSDDNVVVRVTDSSAGPNVFHTTIQVVTGVAAPVITPVANKCFWVTTGKEFVDSNTPGTSFPTCFNGRFGFSVRVGRAQKYTARFQLQTDNGPSSPWGKVIIDRALATPVIGSLSGDSSRASITVKSSPSRFNFGILYSLSRTYTDILATAAGVTPLFTNQTTSSIVDGASIFSYEDPNLIEGVTYNYTLTSTDINYAASPTPLTVNSAVVSYEMDRPVILSATSAAGRCDLALNSFHSSSTYEWGYVASVAGWIGTDKNANAGYTPSVCPGNLSTCAQTGLSAATTYYFAVRATGGGQVGKWSEIMPCRTP